MIAAQYRRTIAGKLLRDRFIAAQSARYRCTLRSCNRCKITTRPLYRCTISSKLLRNAVVQSMCCCCAIALKAVCNSRAVAAQPLHNRVATNHFAIAAKSCCNRFKIGFVFAFSLLCKHWAITPQLVCNRPKIVPRSLCNRPAIVLKLSDSRSTAVQQPLRNHSEIASHINRLSQCFTCNCPANTYNCRNTTLTLPFNLFPSSHPRPEEISHTSQCLTCNCPADTYNCRNTFSRNMTFSLALRVRSTVSISSPLSLHQSSEPLP
jgi:hypothetical protein